MLTEPLVRPPSLSREPRVLARSHCIPTRRLALVESGDTDCRLSAARSYKLAAPAPASSRSVRRASTLPHDSESGRARADPLPIRSAHRARPERQQFWPCRLHRPRRRNARRSCARCCGSARPTGSSSTATSRRLSSWRAIPRRAQAGFASFAVHGDLQETRANLPRVAGDHAAGRSHAVETEAPFLNSRIPAPGATQRPYLLPWTVALSDRPTCTNGRLDACRAS